MLKLIVQVFPEIVGIRGADTGGTSARLGKRESLSWWRAWTELTLMVCISTWGSHRQASLHLPTKQIGSKRIHPVRTRGGNTKYRALRLDNGNFSWGSEGMAVCQMYIQTSVAHHFLSILLLAISRKTRVLDVVYNASNNELVRTKTLVKNCIIQIDSTPFRQW